MTRSIRTYLAPAVAAAMVVLLAGSAPAPAAAQGPNWIVDAMYMGGGSSSSRSSSSGLKAAAKPAPLALTSARVGGRLAGTDYFGSLTYQFVVPPLPSCEQSAAGYIAGLGDTSELWWLSNSLYSGLNADANENSGGGVIWSYTLSMAACTENGNLCPGGSNLTNVVPGDTVSATLSQVLRTDGSGGVTVSLQANTQQSGTLSQTLNFDAPIPATVAYVEAYIAILNNDQCQCLPPNWDFTNVVVTDLQSQQALPPTYAVASADPACGLVNEITNSGPNNSATLTFTFGANGTNTNTDSSARF